MDINHIHLSSDRLELRGSTLTLQLNTWALLEKHEWLGTFKKVWLKKSEHDSVVIHTTDRWKGEKVKCQNSNWSVILILNLLHKIPFQGSVF